MYFEAFSRGPRPALPDEVTYTVEYVISQVLTTASPEFLQEVYNKGRLAQALFDELEFLGQVPKVYLPEVKAYLIKEEPALNDAVGHLLRQPNDEFLRQQLCRASGSPSSRSRA